MGLFNKRGTVIMKEGNSAQRHIDELEQLLTKVPSSVQTRIKRDIKALRAGIEGEARILYELKNSHLIG